MENITLDEWNDEMTLNLIPDTLMLAVYLVVGILLLNRKLLKWG
jgi:hypothetical protein